MPPTAVSQIKHAWLKTFFKKKPIYAFILYTAMKDLLKKNRTFPSLKRKNWLQTYRSNTHILCRTYLTACVLSHLRNILTLSKWLTYRHLLYDLFFILAPHFICFDLNNDGTSKRYDFLRTISGRRRFHIVAVLTAFWPKLTKWCARSISRRPFSFFIWIFFEWTAFVLKVV